jgi:hypothetical protein
VSFGFEVDQLEDPHDLLAPLQIFEAVDQNPWTPAPPVIDPIIAVGSHTQLAEPTEDDTRRRIDGHPAIVGMGCARGVEITGEAKAALRGLGSPGLADGHGPASEPKLQALSW